MQGIQPVSYMPGLPLTSRQLEFTYKGQKGTVHRFQYLHFQKTDKSPAQRHKYKNTVHATDVGMSTWSPCLVLPKLPERPCPRDLT